ncbi:MAG TPA: RbsD/FucU domain-containing protein [Planctomycetaceae bacterium]|nr:RbsD/FucU domain-containing protein [Planctomycetaceae bacterium]
MLKNVPSILSPELFYAIAAMGHGDEIVLADGNFPAESHAQRCIRADGHTVPAVLEAILKFLPLDTFVESPAFVMQPVEDQPVEPPVWADFQSIIDAAEGRAVSIERIERFEFYDRARNAFAVVATGETALYGNLILKKGVVAPDA